MRLIIDVFRRSIFLYSAKDEIDVKRAGGLEFSTSLCVCRRIQIIGP